MRKKILTFLLALVLIFSISIPAYASSASPSDVKKSVAVVAEALQVDGVTTIYGQGTGFFVGKSGEDPKYMVTAYHVISDYLDNGSGQLITVQGAEGVTYAVKALLRIYFDSSDFMEAYVVDYDAIQDFAILRLEGATNKREPLKVAAPTEELVGESMYSAGFPGISDSPVLDPTSQWGMDDAMIARGTVGRLITSSGSGAQYIETTDIVWNSGDSGGPVLHDGTVIGIVKGSTSHTGETQADFESVHVAVSMEPVINLLQKNNIELQIAGSGIDIMKWLPYVLAAVAVAAVIVVIVIVTKKRKTIRGGKKRVVNQVVEKYPTVKSMSPQHNGAQVLIKGTGLTIGRSPNCNIVFAEDTPGVSGVHCSVAFDPVTDDFIVTDLKSTYGTFLMNNYRLPSNTGYRMRSGDSFYLGDSENILRVELEIKK